MRDRGLIAGGIVAFVVAASSPFWLNAARHASAGAPPIERPTDEARCVASVEYMKASHMTLLGEWRDQAVRQGRRLWRASDGRVFTVSLTGTCLRCHANKAAFCDRCHAYVGVSPGCWDCHVAPPPPEAAEGRPGLRVSPRAERQFGPATDRRVALECGGPATARVGLQSGGPLGGGR